MLGFRSLALMCLVYAACAVPAVQWAGINIDCPDQDENSTVVPLANPDNCSTFYECDNGEAKLLACGPDLFFSSKYHVCTYKKDSDCPNKAEEAVFSLSLDDTPTVDFKCPEDEDNTTATYYPNLNNCSQFYECSNERLVQLDCPRRLYFNARLCVCTQPKKSGCTQPDDEDFEAFEEEEVIFEMTDSELSEMRQHIERVYSGKCYKQ